MPTVVAYGDDAAAAGSVSFAVGTVDGTDAVVQHCRHVGEHLPTLATSVDASDAI